MQTLFRSRIQFSSVELSRVLEFSFGLVRFGLVQLTEVKANVPANVFSIGNRGPGRGRI